MAKLNQEELQRKSEQLKEQKINQIKHDIKCCLSKYELPEEIENIILDYSFDESKIETNYSLRKKVNEYYNTKNEHLISELDVSCVTSMYNLFCNFHDFDESLDKWDTSNVVNMRNMFYFCTSFNQPVNFDTKNVIDMCFMFCYCCKFNQLINFNTKNVIDMDYMFSGCHVFNQPVNFDTKNVIDMNCMFAYCYAFNQPVNFDTSNVNAMRRMFHNCINFNQLVKFDTKNMKNMEDIEFMFKNCESLEEKNKLLRIR